MGRLHEVAVRELIAEIVNGRFIPGEWLPREVDLAERFAISRGVARECIRALEERALVQVRHGRGAQVLEPREWDVLDGVVAEEILRGPRPTTLLVEYLECRQGLEIEAAGLAARRSSEQARLALATAFEAMTAAAESADGANGASAPDSEAEFLAADVRFHEALAQASGNRVMPQTLLRMHSALLCALAARASGATVGHRPTGARAHPRRGRGGRRGSRPAGDGRALGDHRRVRCRRGIAQRLTHLISASYGHDRGIEVFGSAGIVSPVNERVHATEVTGAPVVL